jgi:hypothetical protein
MGIANPYWGGNFDNDDWPRCAECGNIICSVSPSHKGDKKLCDKCEEHELWENLEKPLSPRQI